MNIDDIVKRIATEAAREQKDPFLTPYYFSLIERLDRCSEIVIVGAGVYGRELFKILKQNNIHIVKCFADNACGQYKSGIYGIQVVSLEDAVKQNKNADFIVTPQYYIMDLIRQLVKLGVDVEKIDCFIAGNTGMEM